MASVKQRKAMGTATKAVLIFILLNELRGLATVAAVLWGGGVL